MVDYVELRGKMSPYNYPFLGLITMIVGKSGNLALVEAMKKKYKLEKKKRGYAISSIKDKGVHVGTQLLAGKVMRKCCGNEVPMPVVALDEQCT